MSSFACIIFFSIVPVKSPQAAENLVFCRLRGDLPPLFGYILEGAGGPVL